MDNFHRFYTLSSNYAYISYILIKLCWSKDIMSQILDIVNDLLINLNKIKSNVDELIILVISDSYHLTIPCST